MFTRHKQGSFKGSIDEGLFMNFLFFFHTVMKETSGCLDQYQEE